MNLLARFDDANGISVASEELLQFSIRHRPENRRRRNLEAIQVQNWQHCAVCLGIDKFGAMPRRGCWASLRLAIANDARRDEPRIIEYRAKSCRQGVAEFTALMDHAGQTGIQVTGKSAGPAECANKPAQPF